MKNLFTQSVPAWSLALALFVTFFSLTFAWSVSSENTYLKESIQARESLIPGFLGETSILSPEATCRRNLLIGLKDRLIGSDSCKLSF